MTGRGTFKGELRAQSRERQRAALLGAGVGSQKLSPSFAGKPSGGGEIRAQRAKFEAHSWSSVSPLKGKGIPGAENRALSL